MDENDKMICHEIFNTASLLLAEQGQIIPICFITKNKVISPITPLPGMEHSFVEKSAPKVAEKLDADAVIIIGEQKLFDLEEPNNEERYLVLSFMEKNGERFYLVGKIHLSSNQINFVRESEWVSKEKIEIRQPSKKQFLDS